jgi:predicted nuclease with RNAse H fold
MRPLTERAMGLVPELRARVGVRGQVIEVFARASEAILRIKRMKVSEHQWDAYLCALTGRAYLGGVYEDVDGIILPIAGMAKEEKGRE